MDDNPDNQLPLADPGSKPVPLAPATVVPWHPAVLAGAAGALLVIGAIGGMYIQGPFVRAFFGLTGLEPGGGAVRQPIAVQAPPPVQEEVSATGVVALGRLQPLGSVIEVAGPTTASAPRVLDLLVSEGDVVQFDQPMFVLDTYPQLLAARNAAERAVKVSEAALAQASRDVQVGQKESGASLQAARAAAEQAQRDLEREESLYSGDASSAAKLEATRTAAERAAAELRRVQAASGRVGDADIRLAETNLEAARADLARAEAELRTGTVFAPSTGTVMSIFVRPGERAAGGTMLTLADLSRMEAEIEVYQDAVPRIRTGQAVRLQSPVLEQSLNGTIRRIGIEVGRQSLTSSDPAANTDARVVKAWVDVDPASTALAARFVGLEVIAHIDPDPKAAP